MATRELKIEILGDASKAQKAFGEVGSASGQLEGKTSKLGAGFTKMAGLAAGAFAAAGVGSAIKGALDAAAEAQKVSAQTGAVVKSTGGAAGVTADHVGDLAHKLQLMSGVQDETIQSGQNMLLTFTGIKNGVGEGNDIFDQATKAMLDMSVAMGSDASNTAVQLGKALNDPVKGISALSRVGVTFTDQQKEQIKTMMGVGDTAGAQKLILAELGKEFGGSAKAAGDAMTPMDRLSMKWGDMQENIGAKLLPVIEKLANWLTDKVIPAIGRVVGWVQQNWPKVQQVITDTVDKIKGYVIPILDAIKALWSKWGDDILAFAKSTWENIQLRIKGVLDIISGIFRVWASIFKGDWSGVWDGIKQVFSGIWTSIEATLKQALAIIKLLFGTLGEALLDKVKAIPGMFLDLGKDIVKMIVKGIKNAGGAVLDALKDLIPGGGLLGKIGDGIGKVFGRSVDDQFLNPAPAAGAANSMFGEGGPLAGLDTGVADLNALDWANVSSFGGRWEGNRLIDGTAYMADGSYRQIGGMPTQADLDNLSRGGSTSVTIQLPAGNQKPDPQATLEALYEINRINGPLELTIR